MEEFYTVNQVSLILKIHSLTVRRYIKDGKLKAFRVGGNIRIALNDLQNFTQNFVPHQKSQKKITEQSSSTKIFSFGDPLFRLKASGYGTSN